jgi:cytochrome c nitrite reductase small subunit
VKISDFGLTPSDPICFIRGVNRSTIQGIILGTAIGVAAGIGGFTFIYAKGASYLTKDPAACINCHIMREQYDGWIKSSHRLVAACNDGHTPPNCGR